MQHILHFLIDLKFNNNRNWMKANDARYREAKATFEALVDKVLEGLKTFDKSLAEVKATECIFRVYRDARFSANKEPYKTNFGAFMAPGGRKSEFAGYYMHFEPDSSFLGGGIYMPQPDILKALRNHIFHNPAAFKEIINDKSFKKFFPLLWGDTLKTAPAGFPKDFKDIDLLKFKHYVVSYDVSNEFWTGKNLIADITGVFEKQYHFNKFLDEAIAKIR